MITKYISELLYDHECVIIPDFGAFITKETPAVLDYINHRLTPPSKELAFNGQLVSDDGLLIGYVALREGVTTTEAAKMVHDFAMRSLSVIEASSVLRLDGLGVLSRVTGRDYVFQLDEGLNLFGGAFGLTTVAARPVYRKETYQHLAEKIAAEQKAKNTLMTVHDERQDDGPHRVTQHNYKWFRAAAYSMVVAMALVLLGWGADKSDSRFAQWNPFFYSSPNEFIAKHLSPNVTVDATEVPMAEAPAVEAETPAVEDETPAVEAETPAVEAETPVEVVIQAVAETPEEPAVVEPVDDRIYYIIGSSLRSDAAAERCAQAFRKQGFAGAEALPMNDKGNVRVAYEQVTGYDAALRRLEIIKKEVNEAAWLLRKR